MASADEPVRVLHVDDDPEFVALAARFLESEDDRFVVETATSVSDGLARLADGGVDCVVSDYDMPERTGIEFLAAVRQRHGDLPFVLFTGKGSEEVASDAISRGVTDYLQKGTDRSQYAVLANRIRNAVGQYRAERRADRLEEEYRLVATAATDAFWTIDPETDELRFAGGENFGYDDYEPHVDWWASRIHPDDRDRVLDRDEALLAGDREAFDEWNGDRGWFTNEYRWRRADGTYVDCAERGVVRFEDGEAVKMAGTVTDVSDRKARERELQRYERMVNAMPVAACIYDEDGRFAVVNEYLAEFYGTTRAELEGEPSSLVPAVREDSEGDPYQELLDGDREEVRGEIEGTFPAAGTEVLAYRLTPLVVDGEVEGVVGVAREVTERRERERELEARTEELAELADQLEAQYDHLFEEAPVMAVLTRPAEDGAPIVQDCNRRFAETLGYEKAALVGGKLADLYSDDSRRKLLDQGGYDRVLDGEFVRGERELVTAEGETIETLLRAVPRKDADDGDGTLAFYVDVSERRQLRREKERLEEFASIVSHDLRNPLTVAQGNARLAREECDSDRLETVIDAQERMEALIEDLLLLARSGADVDEVEPIDLGTLVDRCWENVDTAAATLVADVDETVRADRGRLKQVLENLVRNAVEHGGEDVTITVGQSEDGFYVADDGPGIPPDDREAVFEAGYSTATEGTGFGLSIVEEIAEAHGWTVRVADSEDGGARFEFSGVESEGRGTPESDADGGERR